MQYHKISIVIPSNGDIKIKKIVSSLYHHDVIDEIIIVFSSKKKVNYKIKKLKKIKYLFSNHSGQVAQRIFGFLHAKNDLVMQLDDDVYLNKKDIHNLLRAKQILKNSSVAPIYIDRKKKNIHAIDNSIFGFMKRILHFLLFSIPISSARMGRVSIIKTNYGVDPKYMKNDYLECDWLPGGCILHEKRKLIYKNYYLLKGKAIGEDIIHSKILRKRNVKLFVSKKSFAITDPQQSMDKNFIKLYFRFLDYVNKKKTLRLFVWKFVFYIFFAISNR